MSLPREQIPALLGKLFRKIRSTQGQPIPVFQWINEDVEQLRQLFVQAPAADIPGLPNEEITNSLGCLKNILEAYLRKQPLATRGWTATVGAMETYLTQPGQSQKMGRIAQTYPNTLGRNGGVDNFTAVSDFLEEVLEAIEIFQARINSGEEWLVSYKQMTSLLSQVKSNLPKVQLMLGSRTELIDLSRSLVESREAFWGQYNSWITYRMNGQHQDGIRVLQTLIPGLDEVENIDFEVQITSIESQDLNNLFCYTDSPFFNPNDIRGLKEMWEDINSTLSAIAATREVAEDVNKTILDVITNDVAKMLCLASEVRHSCTDGERENLLQETNDLLRRVNVSREKGVKIEDKEKEDLMQLRSNLYEDRNVAETKRRLEEAAAKARAAEAQKTAPKTKMMNLSGYPDWVPWEYQLKELTKDLTGEQAKIQLVLNSLAVTEDKNHLKGVTKFSEVMKYLRDKYHRPQEVSASILAKGQRMKKAGDCMKTSKANMLLMLEIRRDLRKLALEHKIDAFYIKTISIKVFTKEDYSRYIREEADFEEKHLERIRALDRLRKSATSSRLPEDIENELREAEKIRNLSDEEDDDSTSVFSFISHRAVEEDSDNARTRKFFFKQIEKNLALIRRIESTEFVIAEDQDNDAKKKKKNNNEKSTWAFKTQSGDERCPIKGCQQIHRNSKTKKISKALICCPTFRNLSLSDKRKIIQSNIICTKCLLPGHRQAACKHTVVCDTCKNTNHHTILCRTKTEKNNTENVASTEEESACHETETEMSKSDCDTQPTTSSNMGRTFALSTTEGYYLDRAGVDRTYTCVGKGKALHRDGKTHVSVHVMCDNCSTDTWVSEQIAAALKLKRLPAWVGQLRTIDGIKSVTLPAVELRLVRIDTGQIVTIEALVTKKIGFKQSIETIRFNRLCSAFGLKPSEVDNSHGECDILLGLKCQSLMAFKVAEFQSDIFPEVGIYQSPILEKLMFVGSSHQAEPAVNLSTATSSNFRCETSDNQLRDYLAREEQININDILCENCLKPSLDCANCKAARNQTNLQELEEDERIRNALQIRQVVDQDGVVRKEFVIEYPIKEGVNINQLYTINNSNRSAAIKSSCNLRRKLIKEGQIDDFHLKVWEGVEKQQYVVVTDEVQQLHQKYPESYQLINYIVKESSASTKLRVVTNSSIYRRGGSFNENTVKGSSMLNNSCEILYGFCAHIHAILTDIKEAYRSTKTGPQTNSLRRFFWFNNPHDENTMVELMLVVSTYGDKTAGNILAQCLNIIANDESTSYDVKKFIGNNFYVDDGLLSSDYIEKLEAISRDLPETFRRYGFTIKHVLKSYEKSKGITNTDHMEQILGLAYDFIQDTITPSLEIYLCKKKRGKHVDQALCNEVISSTPITLRVILRAVGSIYDLTGRHLGPLQLKGKIIYSDACRVTSKWDEEISKESEIYQRVIDFLKELIAVKAHLHPAPRSWYDTGQKLENVIVSSDGGIRAFGTVCHIVSLAADGSRDSRVAASRSKLSNLDCGDNELAGTLLAMKMAEGIVRSIPEPPKSMNLVLLTDSQCTAFALNPSFCHKERRRKNLAVRFHRVLRRVHNQLGQPILLAWIEGLMNPADLVSKEHCPIVDVLNGEFWRKGPKKFVTGPIQDNVRIFAYLKNDKFTWVGLPNSGQHMTTCCLCSLLQSPVENQNPKQPVDLSSKSGSEIKTKIKNYGEILTQFTSINSLVYGLSRLLLWKKKVLAKTSGLLARGDIWLRLIETSQTIFPPENIKQLQPFIYKKTKVLGTKNRLNNYGLAKYHRNGWSFLPIVSHKDIGLVTLLVQNAHIKFIGNNPVHLTKSLTLTNLRQGVFAAVITQASRIVERILSKCVTCKRDAACGGEPAPISDKFLLRYMGPEKGVYSAINMDIIGPYVVNQMPETRGTRKMKLFVLVICCQLTAAIHLELMYNYSTNSVIDALENHISLFKKPDMITVDAGSQFRGMITREQAEVDPGICIDNQMIDAIKKKFRNVTMFVASTNAQHQNGKVEAQIKVMKRLLRSHFRLLKHQSIRFSNLFELRFVLLNICRLLNSRAVLVDGDEIVTVRDLICPGLISQESDSITELSEKTHEANERFVEMFKSEIVNGRFQIFGGKTIVKKRDLKPGDFCLVFAANSHKYCIIESIPTPHHVFVKLLKRRYKDGSGKAESEKHDVRNIVFLYRP